MKYGINTIDDFDFKDKTVICRLDLNSPYDRQNDCLKDITRIKAAVPTIKELSEHGAKLVLMSHQGGDLEYQNFVSTSYHAKVLSGLIGKQVEFIDDICGPFARQAIKSLKSNQIILLDNVRYMAEEMTLFETKLKLNHQEQQKTLIIQKLFHLADIYVCDAFAAAHRDQPTLVAFEDFLPSAMGRLFEKEYEVLSKIISAPTHPCIFVLGGAKIEDAFDMMPKVLADGVADKILTSGLLGQLFYIAQGISLGNKSEEVIYKKKLDEYLPRAKEILDKHSDKIMVPCDFAAVSEGQRIEFYKDDLPSKHQISDIGSNSISQYKDILSNAGTVFINGPCGIFEDSLTEAGTKELFCCIANLDAFSVIGGGDSITAINKYNIADKFSYVCTGGGAMVRFLSGEELPVIRALKNSAIKFK
jgi:phosphoglycerate kinase